MTPRADAPGRPRLLFACAAAALLAAVCFHHAAAAGPEALARQRQPAPAATPAATPAPAAATPTPAPTPEVPALARIEFVGLRRVGQEEAVAASGLQAGQPVDVDLIDQAAGRLLDSGLFTKLSYSFRTAKGQATVVFTVEEAGARAPVVFDNFVWFSDRELDAYVSSKVEGYDGTAAEAGTTTERIAKALGEMLLLKGIRGQVVYTPSTDPVGRGPVHLFSVRGATGLRVCSLSFPGARTITEEELVRKSTPVFDNEYSRIFVNSFLLSNLLPLYHERGLLRASFAPLRVTKAAPSGDCPQGLAVTAPLAEGSIYVWGGAEWSGQTAMTPQELDIALGIRQRDVAGSARLEKGLEALRRAYGRKGYLTARVAGTPEFDDANRRVLYRFKVTEGAQYRMGTLTLNGLDERDTINMKVRWRIFPGEVFDAGYPDEFLKKNVQEFARDLLRDGRKPTFTKVAQNIKVDNDKLTVDVTLDFKN